MLQESWADKARGALLERFRGWRPSVAAERGYVTRLEENLLPGVVPDHFCQDFAGAGGGELASRALDPCERPPKFWAVHSSAALAVNVFAPWKRDARCLELAGVSGFSRLRFEAPCSSGLPGTPPTLDVLAWDNKQVVAVESKCLEYLAPHKARFEQSYYDLSEAGDDRCSTVWWKEVLRLREDPHRYDRLDAAQLIKHYLGLARTFPDREARPNITLLYVFWEPANWAELPEPNAFRQHRDEVSAFARCLEPQEQCGGVVFRAQSYLELWTEWAGRPEPRWLAEHLAQLRARYKVTL